MVAMNVWPTDAADGSVANEARWRKMARGWQPTGVNAGVGGEMVPTLAGMNLTVKSGSAWVDGHYCELLGDQVLAVTPNGLAVVRFDPAANSAQLLYLDGATVPAQSPTGIYEMPIAQIVGSGMVDKRSQLSGNAPRLNGDYVPSSAVALVGGAFVRIPWTPRPGATIVPDVNGDILAKSAGQYLFQVQLSANLDPIATTRPNQQFEFRQYAADAATLLRTENFINSGSNWTTVAGFAIFTLAVNEKVQVFLNADWSTGVKTLDAVRSHLTVLQL